MRSMAAAGPSGRVLDHLPVAVALVDLDGTIRYVNPAAVARYGWRSAESAIGLTADVLGEGLPNRLTGTTRWQGELRATSGDGATFVAAFDVAPFRDEDGTLAGSLVVCLDASRRAEAERSAERLARLQAVTARLGGARDVADVASVVCDHAAAGVGAHAVALFRLVDDETFELVRQVGFDAESASRFARFPADAPLPACDAVRTRSIVVLCGEPERGAAYPALADVSMRHQTHAVVPVLLDDRRLGAIAFGFRRARTLNDDDRRFLHAVAAQAGQTLDRIRSVEQERAARRRQELLARVTGVLGGSLDLEVATGAAGRMLVQEFADAVSVYLLDDDRLRPVTIVNGDPELEELMVATWEGAVGDAVLRLLDDVIAAGRSILVPTLAPDAWDLHLGDASAAEAMRALDVASIIVVGLHARGERLGALVVSRGRDREPFDEEAFALVAELASRTAVTVDNALAHRARAEVARTLQASLLPPELPEIPGMAIASRYDPVGDGSLVGGDFYDVFPVAGGRWCLVLGDVCGQGVLAAALTSLVRYTVRAAARVWQSPAEILRFTNDAILDHDTGERFCTLLVAVVQPDAQGLAVTLAAGGHHLPLLRPAGGTPRAVGRLGTAMGLIRHPDVGDTTVRMGVGDVLVLTTDGVIEARDEHGALVGDGFLEHLVDVHAGDGAEALAEAIERSVLAVGGGRALDDVAVLVLEITGAAPGTVPADPAAGDGPFDRRFPADTASVTDARRAVSAWLDGQPIRGSRVPDLLLALTELVTNAVRSARTAVEVRAWLTPDAVMFEVTDDGPGFDPTVPRSPRELDPFAERGRGLFIVAALVDECTIESGANGTIVRCYMAR